MLSGVNNAGSTEARTADNRKEGRKEVSGSGRKWKWKEMEVEGSGSGRKWK